MKLRLLAITALAVLALTGCKKDDGVFNDNFDISSGNADMSGDKLTLGYEEQTIVIDVTAEDAAGKWNAYSPTNDVWCSFSRKGGQLILTVDANTLTDEVRSTWIEFVLGENSRKIVVEQDFLRKLAFATTTMTVGPSADNLSLPYTGNIPIEELAVTTSPADASWVTNLAVTDGAVTGVVQRNPSVTDTRSVDIVLAGGKMETTLTLTQNQLSGYPYVIDLSGADFEDAYIYELWDATHTVKIGELCKEYLRKRDEQNNRDIVKMSAVVAYPMLKEGGVDYANGFIVNNGGSIVWNMAITSETEPSNHIASYTAGTLAAPATMLYLGEGAVKFSTTPLAGVPESELIYAELRPYTVTDTRTGAENNAGQTTETYTYKVVKVGTQYWMAENLKTTRYRDGAPIPTNISSDEWAIAKMVTISGSKAYTPGCWVAEKTVPGGVDVTNIDANSPDISAVRDEHGVQYNFHAIVNQSATVDAAMNPQSFVDMVSPAGWGIPAKEEMQTMLRYVSQATGSWFIPEISAYGTNETGLSLSANIYRGRTGGVNRDSSNYWTMSGYQFTAREPGNASTAHSMTTFRIVTDDFECLLYETLGNTTTTMNAVNVRCLRK